MSYIKTITNSDGELVDSEGCHWDSAEMALADLFGFCGCGNTRSALMYMRKIMHYINQKIPKDIPIFGEAWSNYCNEKMKQEKEIFGSDGPMYVAYYLLDDKKITEHGGSVPGWLTKFGEDILHDLDELAKED